MFIFYQLLLYFYKMKEVKKEEIQTIKENFKFVWKNEIHQDETSSNSVTKQYYDTLFKEYCIADLSLYKEGR
jgi:protein FRA10AC1